MHDDAAATLLTGHWAGWLAKVIPQLPVPYDVQLWNMFLCEALASDDKPTQLAGLCHRCLDSREVK
jgi:hypothetical protein